MNTIKKYDCREVYENEIAEHVKTLEKLCVKHDLPFMFSVAVANSEEKTEYIHEGISAASLDFKLKDDLLSKYLVVISGGKFVLPSQVHVESESDYMNAHFEDDVSGDDAGDSGNAAEGFCDDAGNLNYK